MKRKEEQLYKDTKEFILVWYTTPNKGGYREVMLKERYLDGLDINLIARENNIPGEDLIFAVWQFDTIEELMKADRREWRERYLDKIQAEEIMLRKMTFNQ